MVLQTFGSGARGAKAWPCPRRGWAAHCKAAPLVTVSTTRALGLATSRWACYPIHRLFSPETKAKGHKKASRNW